MQRLRLVVTTHGSRSCVVAGHRALAQWKDCPNPLPMMTSLGSAEDSQCFGLFWRHWAPAPGCGSGFLTRFVRDSGMQMARKERSAANETTLSRDC